MQLGVPMGSAKETRKFAARAAALLVSAAALAMLAHARAADPPGDWASYNRTLTSERYVPFDQINRGNAGGDRYEGRGRVYALDAQTGKMAWETYLVPNDGPPAPNNERMQALARQSWGNARGVPVSGGATWTSYTLDPVKGLLYVPGG